MRARRGSGVDLRAAAKRSPDASARARDNAVACSPCLARPIGERPQPEPPSTSRQASVRSASVVGFAGKRLNTHASANAEWPIAEATAHARTGATSASGALRRRDSSQRRATLQRRSKIGLPLANQHLKTFLRIEPCTPQLASTTWVTPKSAATDISAIASSSLNAVHGHQEPPQLAERIAHRLVEARMIGDFGLRVGAEFGEIVREGEAVDRPLRPSVSSMDGSVPPASCRRDRGSCAGRIRNRRSARSRSRCRRARCRLGRHGDRRPRTTRRAPRPDNTFARPCRCANRRYCRRYSSGGIELTKSASAGARPMVPKCRPRRHFDAGQDVVALHEPVADRRARRDNRSSDGRCRPDRSAASRR